MIRANQKFLNLLHILTDGFLVFLSFHISYVLRFYYLNGDHSGFPYFYYFTTSFLAVFIQISVYSSMGLYASQRKERFRHVLWRIFQGNLFAAFGLVALLYLLKWTDISRLTVGLFFLTETVILSTKRFFLLKILHHLRAQGFNQKHIIVVGAGTLATHYLSELKKSPELGYNVIGYISTEDHPFMTKELPFLGTYQEIYHILSTLSPDEVVVATSPQEYTETHSVILACEKTGTKMSMIPFYTQFFPGNPQIDYLNQIPMLHLRPNPLEHFFYSALKRSIDFFGSLFLLSILSPLLLIIALGVKISTKGSVIFKQIRVGKDKQEFCMYKFRSMSVGSPQEEQGWTTKENPRKTKFGSFIRKCSLDELPQLFNVLKGEMSLIGPRPELPVYVEQFKEEIPHYMVKHQVRPGMTGWAQVRGLRGDTSILERIRHDIYYIEHWSLWFDLKIVVLTLLCGFINEEPLGSSPNIAPISDGKEGDSL